MESTSEEVTELLSQLALGNHSVESRLIPLVYAEMRRIAQRYMRQERKNHTLQATALVHEAYIKLIDQHSVNWENRAQFFGIAANVMRRILVDHARTRDSQKRGGGAGEISLDEALVYSPERSSALLELDAALDRLAAQDPRQAKIIEMRFFTGLSVEEVAEVLGVSPKTIKRDWSMAKAWLHRELRAAYDPGA
jgi:RNA polymerase sigma factor (TIGR02999 family)